MKYNINLIRGYMRLTTIVIATVALASSSFGALYDTLSQFEPRKADDVTRVDSMLTSTNSWRLMRARGCRPAQSLAMAKTTFYHC